MERLKDGNVELCMYVGCLLLKTITVSKQLTKIIEIKVKKNIKKTQPNF